MHDIMPGVSPLFVHDFLFGPPATQNTFSPYLHMNETFPPYLRGYYVNVFVSDYSASAAA